LLKINTQEKKDLVYVTCCHCNAI